MQFKTVFSHRLVWNRDNNITIISTAFRNTRFHVLKFMTLIHFSVRPVKVISSFFGHQQ